MLTGHFLHNDAPATETRRRARCVAALGALVVAGLLVTGCGGKLGGAIKSLAPSASLPSRSTRASPTAAPATQAPSSPSAAAPAPKPKSSAESSTSSGSSLIWLWVAIGVVLLIIVVALIARSDRSKPPAAGAWQSRALDAYARGSALYDAMRMAEAPGALVAADAAARWADIQRRADDLGQALYAMREAAPDEDKRLRAANVLAALQAVRSAMAAERGTDVSRVPPPELVRSRLMAFSAALQDLREPDERLPY